jgi:PST family polysaccharide transporter
VTEVPTAEKKAALDDAAPATSDHFRTDHLHADMRGHTVRGGAVTLMSQFAQFGLQVASTIVLARLLTPADYGLVGKVAVVTGFIGLFKELGLSQATVQRDQIEQADVSALFWLNVIASAALVLITVAVAPLVAWIYHDPKVTRVTVLLGACFIFSGLSAQHGALLRRQMRFSALAIADLTGLVVGIAVAIVMARRGFGYWALIGQGASQAAAQVIVLWILCRWRPGWPGLTARARSMARFGANLVGFDFFNYLSRNADNFLIGWRWGDAPLGVYSKAYGLLMLPLRQISNPVSAVAVPLLSRLQDDSDRYRRAYRQAVDALNFITMPGIAFLIVTSDWIVPLVLGAQWTEASRIFMYLGICGLVQPLANSTGWLFISQGRSGEMARWGIISGTLLTTSFLIGLHWKGEGVAIAYSICVLLVACPILFHLVGNKGPVTTRELYRSLAQPALAVLCVLASLGAFRKWSGVTDPRLGIAASILIAFVVTVGTYALTAPGRRVLQQMLAMIPHVPPNPIVQEKTG